MNDSLLLPKGSRLLHIGPHKTGTTSLQSALHHNRERLAAQGVRYVSQGRNPMRAVTAVTARRSMIGEVEPSMEHWERLVEAFRSAEAARVVLSSEFFADAQSDDDVADILDALGRDGLHVVVTLRPLAKLLGSQWQQYVQNGLRLTHEKWLEAMFADPPNSRPTPSFWRRHRHDRLVRRWADQVGADHVTVVVVNDSDRQMLPRTFERMLGLSEGTLVPEPDRLNRSLTYAEAEMLRRFNVRFRGNEWPLESYAQLIRHGAVVEVKGRRPDGEDAVVTPRWAMERAVRIGAEAAEQIEASGVRVVGDLSVLGDEALLEAGGPPPPDLVRPEAVARALVGAIEASATAKQDPPDKGPYVDALTSRQLLGIVGGRARRRLGRGR